MAGHGGVRRGPFLRGRPPPWEEAFGDSSLATISFQSLPPRLSSLLPCCPKITPEARCPRYGAQPEHSPLAACAEHSRSIPAAGRRGQQDLLAPRGMEEGATGARRLLGTSGDRSGGDEHGAATVTLCPAQPSPRRCPELPRRLSHARGAALTACAHSPLASQAISMPKCHQSPAATSARPISGKGQGGARWAIGAPCWGGQLGGGGGSRDHRLQDPLCSLPRLRGEVQQPPAHLSFPMPSRGGAWAPRKFGRDTAKLLPCPGQHGPQGAGPRFCPADPCQK